jgi:dinuclear metal center YbgI/SA1388 family protein
MVLLGDLVKRFNDLWPLELAEDWDRPGLTIGSKADEITKILLAVDITAEVLDEALSVGADLVLSHHPLLLRGVNELGEETLKGQLVTKAIRNSVALFSAHTNADVVSGGVSDVLARKLGLNNLKPLAPINAEIGHGRVGLLEKPLSLRELANIVHSTILTTKAPVRVAGNLTQSISKVAVVGGAGDSFIPEAMSQGVDCFITSDLRHHVVLDVLENPSSNMSIIDISHFAGEGLWLSSLENQLSELFPNLEIQTSKVITDPWSLSLTKETAL